MLHFGAASVPRIMNERTGKSRSDLRAAFQCTNGPVYGDTIARAIRRAPDQTEVLMNERDCVTRRLPCQRCSEKFDRA
jgi:hypothetical protein